MQVELDFTNTKFFGAGYNLEKDQVRLSGQVERVFNFMISREQNGYPWVGLAEISQNCDAPEASASACLRTLRNQYGYVVERKRSLTHSGLHLYRLDGKRNNKAKKKIKPIGNPELFGKMLKNIFAYSHTPDRFTKTQMHIAAVEWASAFAGEIGEFEYEID